MGGGVNFGKERLEFSGGEGEFIRLESHQLPLGLEFCRGKGWNFVGVRGEFIRH